MASFKQVLNQGKSVLAALDTKQLVILMGGAGFITAMVIFFGRMIATPDYKPLMTGMEATDAQSLAGRLAAKNIPYQLSPDGKTVSVPSDKLDSSRLQVASEGMPHSGRLGFELFDKLNWGQTEFDENVNYQRALEGELERTIQTLRDVESVRVHLVMPTESVFLDREREAKASVILRLRSGQLSEDTHRAIASLVSGAVDKLAIQNVTVIDADTNQPLVGRRQGANGSDAELEEQLSQRLVSTLEPVVGTQRIRASVNVEYDPSSSEENQETYDPKSAVAVTMQRSEEQTGGGDTAGGIPGTASNVPDATASDKTDVAKGDPTKTDATKTDADTTQDDSADAVQISKTENGTYAVDKLVRHTLLPAGRIRRMSAAVLVDDAVDVQQQNGKPMESRRKRTPEELKQIEVLAAAAIGLDEKRGDTLAVQNLSFQQIPEKSPELPTRLERVRVVLNDWSMIIRYAALLALFLLAYLFLLRPIKKQAVAILGQLPDRAEAQLAAEMKAKEFAGLPPGAAAWSEAERRTIGLQKQLAEKVKSEPAVTGRMVQNWLREGAQ
jgi:flagellar M-ring protein FliF